MPPKNTHLEKLLAQEHSRSQCDRIVDYIGNNKERFSDLMQLFFEGEYRITQRVAWPMSYCVHNHPELIRPYFKPLLDNLHRKGLHVAVTRNTLRLLQDVTIPKKFQGQVMSMCFGFIQSPETPIAVKAFSLNVLYQLSLTYPEILPELKLIIEEQWEHSSPAFRVSAKKILKDLIKGRGISK